jgi:hypothetical protein
MIHLPENLMSELVNNIAYRAEILGKLTIKNRIEISSAIERYQSLTKERLLIAGRLYGSKKYQEIDARLHSSQVSLREKVKSTLSLY